MWTSALGWAKPWTPWWSWTAGALACEILGLHWC